MYIISNKNNKMGNSPKKDGLLKEGIRQRYLNQLTEDFNLIYFLSAELHFFNSQLNYHNSWKNLLQKLLSNYNKKEIAWKTPILRYVQNLSIDELVFQRALFWEIFYSINEKQSKENEKARLSSIITHQEIVKKLFKIILKEKNCFFKIISLFKDSIIKKYGYEDQFNEEDSKAHKMSLIFEIEAFKNIIIKVLVCYLNIIVTNTNEIIYTKLHRRIMNHILNDYIYDIILKLFCQEKAEEIEMLRKIFSKKKNIISIQKL